MSYLVLARKSRPQRFDEVIGQKAVVRTLENALKQDRVAHAIIFSGVRGTGKTTLARIMAKALNCTRRQGAEPCNECQSCREISAGTSVDLQEVDGASNRGIQEIRELKERIRFQPSSSRYKVFIIDEVHMLTTEAFNALLKTLEEPPEHVYFMFATTELHKVPLTILSRCQRFELKRLSLPELRDHFASLAAQEGVTIAPQALDMVAREAAGSVRDGLSLLDQVFSYCGQQVDEADVQEVLGLVTRQAVAELGSALLHADLAKALAFLGALQDQGVDMKRLASDLLNWFRELLLCKLGAKTGVLLGLPEEELAALQELVAPYPETRLSAFFNVLMDAMHQHGQEPRLALELACIRTVQVAEVTPTAELIRRFNTLLGDAPLPRPDRPEAADRPVTPPSGALPAPRLEAAPAPPLPERATHPAPSPPRRNMGGRQQTRTPPPFTDAPPPPLDDVPPPVEEASPAFASPPDNSPPPPEAPVRHPAPFSPAEQTPAVLEARIQQSWRAFANFVQERIKWMGLALPRVLNTHLENGVLVVRFQDLSDCIMLKQDAQVKKLAAFACEFFQTALTVRIEEEEANLEEINPQTGRTRLEERKALAAEPVVLTALEVFGGQLGEIRTGIRYMGQEKPMDSDRQAQAGDSHFEEMLMPEEDD